MKKNKVLNLIIMFALFAMVGLSASAQVLSEKRPFDFSDKYYGENGIEAALIYERRNGADKYSVFGTINDDKYRQVRIIGTEPAYGSEGKLLFWNTYGELFEDGFKRDTVGQEARDIARRFPIFMFPSTSVPDSDRQAALIDTSGGYFQKNLLGLGIIVLVEYTGKADDETLKSLGEKNGLSLDGTPIIRTAKELADLTRRGFVTQRVRGSNSPALPSYLIGRAIEDPTMGAIAPDAFLMQVLRENGKPLEAEEFMADQFKCLQLNGNQCDFGF